MLIMMPFTWPAMHPDGNVLQLLSSLFRRTRDTVSHLRHTQCYSAIGETGFVKLPVPLKERSRWVGVIIRRQNALGCRRRRRE